MTNNLLFGYTWDEIQHAQQGGRLSHPLDLSKPSKTPATDADRALLAEHGPDKLREMGLVGVLDRLGLLENPHDPS